ncbi:MAG: non-reducing end alpha-L-arabinofuranosidase family hydrolase [Verrucomicrobiota bacterium]
MKKTPLSLFGISATLLFIATLVGAESPVSFSWTVGSPVLKTRDFGNPEWIAIKDPSIVRYDGKWHLFCTLRGHAIVYSSFEDFSGVADTTPVVLPNHGGYFCAPQVFWYSPQEKWYMICQAKDKSWDREYQAAYATTDDISDASSWSPLQPLNAVPPPEGNPWLDFWVIRHGDVVHLFFTSDNGKIWREETTVDAFPLGWSEPVLAFDGDIFEANHVYRVDHPQGKFLNLVEAQARGDRRYFKAYLGDDLHGEWTPIAGKLEQPYAAAWGSGENVEQTEGRWTHGISHGELLRKGFDENMKADFGAPFFFQGVLHPDRQGKDYGKIPWDLGLLTPFREQE